MLSKRTAVRGVLAVCMAVLGGSVIAAEEGDGGTITGTLTEKGEKWIEVKADGSQDAVRYTPRWIGGLPKDGGGLDKEMLATIRDLQVGSRVKLDWKYEERPRVLNGEVLKKDTED